MGKLKDREINYLGALLHDIGKLVWRAKPISSGETHEKLGEEFIREYLGKISCLRDDIEEIIKAANRKRGKIWKADIIAAEEREESIDKFPRRYLQAITNRIDLSLFSQKSRSSNYFYYTPKALEINNIFPVESDLQLDKFTVDEEKFVNEHEELLNNFINELESLKDYSDFYSFIVTFYKLLEKFTSKVLSAGYLSHPDISLFDHSRITAALSLCFEEGDVDKPILMIKGDITGIQDYIYGELYKMENIAKRLRARSFFIHLILETISQYYLDKLNIFPPNILYLGGGHFILIVPNNENSRKLVVNLENEVSKKLIDSYLGKISFVQAFLELSEKEFIIDFEESFNKLENLINNKKRQKNVGILKELFLTEFHAAKIRDFNEKISSQEELLGKKLVKSKWILQVIYDPLQTFKISENLEPIPFEKFFTYYFLVQEASELENLITSNAKAKYISIINLNETNFLEIKGRKRFENIAFEYWFIGNYVPTNNNEVMSFEDLAKLESENYPLLGILRLDVDNLGAVFRFGLKEKELKEKKFTPSRVAYLSRELNIFFEWYINALAKKHSIYIAYSGGDDVFVVGNWYKILLFAKDLREEFHKFSSRNNYLSLSGGILFTKPNFPISQAAILAGEQEKMAKRTKDPLEKDRIGIFDVSFSWSDFDLYIQKAEQILEVIKTTNGKNKEELIPRSFIHSLLNLTKRSFDRMGRINVYEFIKSKNKILYQFARRKVTDNVITKENIVNGQKILNDALYNLALDFLRNPEPEEFYKKFQLTASIILYKTRR